MRCATATELPLSSLLPLLLSLIGCCLFHTGHAICQKEFLKLSTPAREKNNVSGTILPGACYVFELNANEYMFDPDCNNAGSILVMEVWLLDVQKSYPGIYFAVSRTTNTQSFPGVSSTVGGLPLFSPPLAPMIDSTATYAEPDSTYIDSSAIAYQRMYHRIVLPMDAANQTNGVSSIWRLMVANTLGASTQLSLNSYTVRGQCYTPADVPCPRSIITIGADGPPTECTALIKGSCEVQVTLDPLNRQCECALGWGDYTCNTVVTQLQNDTPISVSLGPGEMHFFNVQVPTLVVPYPMLLVELTRALGTSWGSTGDPLLSVRRNAFNSGSSAPLHTVADYSAVVSDAAAYSFYQTYHYMMAGGNSVSGAKFEVSILNSIRRFMSTAVVTINARWLGSSSAVLCPADCSGHGTCVKSVMSSSEPEGNFICNCNKGYGGTFCEGTLTEWTVFEGVSLDNSNQINVAGQWDYYRLTIDQNKFKESSETIQLYWSIDTSRSPGFTINGVLAAVQDSTPRDGYLAAGSSTYSSTQMAYYSTLTDSYGATPRSIVIRGADLDYRASYLMIGIYSFVAAPFKYSFQLDVSRANTDWLKPYMSVIIGVAAAVIVCVLLTICKRQLQRRGIGPWRSNALSPDSPPSGTIRMITTGTQRRLQGVPASIVSGFEVFEYKSGITHLTGKGGGEKLEVCQSCNSHTEERARKQAEAAAATTEAATAAAAAGARELIVDRPSSLLRSHGTLVGSSLRRASEADVVHALPLAGHDGDVIDEEDEGPCCTVCLCEYEENEMLRRLPCKHEFHLACIDKWMTQHTTCPVCRFALVPEPTPEELEAAEQEQQQRLEGQLHAMARGPWVISNGPNNTVFLAAPRQPGADGRPLDEGMGVVLVMYPGGSRNRREPNEAPPPELRGVALPHGLAPPTRAALISRMFGRSTIQTQAVQMGAMPPPVPQSVVASPPPPYAIPLTSPLGLQPFGGVGSAPPSNSLPMPSAFAPQPPLQPRHNPPLPVAEGASPNNPMVSGGLSAVGSTSILAELAGGARRGAGGPRIPSSPTPVTPTRERPILGQEADRLNVPSP